MFDPEASIILDELRARLRAMDDGMLARWGASAAYMCTPEANLGAAPRQGVRRATPGSPGGMAKAPSEDFLENRCAPRNDPPPQLGMKLEPKRMVHKTGLTGIIMRAYNIDESQFTALAKTVFPFCATPTDQPGDKPQH
jgi:hypothetical protein